MARFVESALLARVVTKRTPLETWIAIKRLSGQGRYQLKKYAGSHRVSPVLTRALVQAEESAFRL